MQHFVVVGAGQAGFSLVAKLRASGFDGRITLIGSEPEPPYQRPPLSKAYLLGEMERERLYLRPRAFYDDQKIDLILGREARTIDLEAREVVLDDQAVPYDKLAITTGMMARTLPTAAGGDLDGVHVVRLLAHADALAPDIKAAKRMLVVGGGYIGLEAAAVARKFGLEVTLIELADRILARVACEETAAYFRALHEDHGVVIREGTGLDHLAGEDGRVTGGVLSDGTTVPADVVVAGIGLLPRCKIADAAGLEVSNGVKTDAFGQTSDPNVWAAGDCASFPYHGERIRLESVQNAIDQAEVVAQNMLGAGIAYEPHPWFWSDQYDVKLQIAGLNTGYDQVIVRKGEKSGAQSHWYFRQGRLISVDAMSDPRAYMVGKRMIEMGLSPAPEVIADPATDLKAQLRRG